MPAENAAVIPLWPESRLDSIQRALARREELRANTLDMQALMADARAIRLKVLPNLSLTAQLQRNSINELNGTFNDNNLDKRTQLTGYTTFLGLTFDWKLLDGGIRNAEANATDAKARQTLAQEQLLRLRITKDVADAYATFVASKIQVDAARADVDASRRSLGSAIRNYEAGRTNDEGTTVVQALTKLQTALNIYRTLVADQNTSIYQLYRGTATWPSDAESLVRAQYQQWLAPPTAQPLPATKP